jgi:methionyl-tRNA synthetase
VHFVGKDIARWHAILWPAMLKSVGYTPPSTIYVHGFINLNGEKISKSKGNVIKPSELVIKYGTDAVRYYFLKYGPIIEDVDISIEQFENVYNGELANGLGNTVARIAKLAERSGIEFPLENVAQELQALDPIKDWRVDNAIQNIWKKISDLDKHVNTNAPWNIKNPEELEKVLKYEVAEIRNIAQLIEPFLPTTQERINQMFSSTKIRSGDILFPRI